MCVRVCLFTHAHTCTHYGLYNRCFSRLPLSWMKYYFRQDVTVRFPSCCQPLPVFLYKECFYFTSSSSSVLNPSYVTINGGSQIYLNAIQCFWKCRVINYDTNKEYQHTVTFTNNETFPMDFMHQILSMHQKVLEL